MNELRYLYKHIIYKLFARHKNGHGIHSPFLFSFLTNVVFVKKNKGLKRLKKSNCKNISRRSLKTIKIIDRTIEYFNPDELCFVWESFPKKFCTIINRYKDLQIVIISKQATDVNEIFEKYAFKEDDLDYYSGKLPDVFYKYLQKIHHIQFLIIDAGNEFIHNQDFYNRILSKTSSGSVIFILNIHRSKISEQFWNSISDRPEVKQSIDFFSFGMLFFKHGLQKEHFVVRY